MHEGIGQQSPNLTMADGLSIELHDFCERLPLLLVAWGGIEKSRRKHLQSVANNVNDNQPLADLAPLHEGSQIAGTFPSIILTIVDTHETVSRRRHCRPALNEFVTYRRFGRKASRRGNFENRGLRIEEQCQPSRTNIPIEERQD